MQRTGVLYSFRAGTGWLAGLWKRTSRPSKAVRVSRGDELNVNESETSGSNFISNKQGYENWWVKNIFWPRSQKYHLVISEPNGLHLWWRRGSRWGCSVASPHPRLQQMLMEQKGLTTWPLITFVLQKWETLIHLTTIYWATTKASYCTMTLKLLQKTRPTHSCSLGVCSSEKT